MLAGVPPIVFPHGGIAGIVRHGHTGLVVRTPREYAQALEYLYHNPGERKRLGDNARSFVQEQFDGQSAARHMEAIYQRLLHEPKRKVSPVLPGLSAAERFARYMLPADQRFEASLHERNWRQAIAADRELAASSMPAARGEGGIIQFRNACPEDPDLIGWSGLVQAGLGRWEQALSEFSRALELRPEHWRQAWYRAVAQCHAHTRDSAQGMIVRALSLAASAGMDRPGIEHLELQANLDLPELFVF
jgi:tetratricopeptide (TPR) repeat protein